MTQTDDPTSLRFAVNRSEDARDVVLSLTGELDLASAPDLEEALRQVELQSYDRLVLDLSQLSFMDSTGLAIVIAAKEHADLQGRRFVLRRPTSQVTRLLALVALLDQFVIED